MSIDHNLQLNQQQKILSVFSEGYKLALAELLHKTYNNRLLQEHVHNKPLLLEDHNQAALQAQDQSLLVFQLETLGHHQLQEDHNLFLNLNHVNQRELNPPELSQLDLSHQELNQQEPSLQYHLKQLSQSNQELNKDNQSESSPGRSFLLNNFLLSKLVVQLNNNNQLLFEVYLSKLKLDSYPPQVNLFNLPPQSPKEDFKISQM